MDADDVGNEQAIGINRSIPMEAKVQCVVALQIAIAGGS